MQKKIQDAKIVIIGVGGTGSHLALSLASMGVGALVLIDGDDARVNSSHSIELSNTSRQVLYDETDIGKNKLDVAAEKLKKYNKNLSVVTHGAYIAGISDLDILSDHKDSDLIVLSADTPRGEIPYIVDDVAQKLSISWLGYGPYLHSQVGVGPLIVPGRTKSYTEQFPKDTFKDDDRVNEIRKNFRSAIIDPFNGLAARIAAIEILKHITGYAPVTILGKEIVVDSDSWTIGERG